jgi:hypothetical protein
MATIIKKMKIIEKSLIFLIYLRKAMILYETDYSLYTVLLVKSPAFLEEKFSYDSCKV